MISTGARPPNSFQFQTQPPSMFQHSGGLVSAYFHWPCKAQGCGPSCFGLWEALFLPVFIGRTAAAYTGASRCYWHSLLKIVPVYACTFTTRVLNHTLQFNSAASSISPGGLVFDLVFRSSQPLHNFSLTTQRTAFWRPPGRLQLLGDRKHFDLPSGL